MKKLLTPADFAKRAEEAGLGHRSEAWARRVFKQYGVGKKVAGRHYTTVERADEFLSLDAALPDERGSP